MTRREAVKLTALATAGATLLPAANAQPAAPMTAAPAATPTGPFKLPPLPYAYDALEPHIDAQTMQIHHDKHHQAYVTNLNAAVAGHADLEKKSIEELLVGVRTGVVPEAVRIKIQNNGGGHYNHSLFWQIMAKGGGGEPKGELAAAIDKKFKNFAGFKAELTAAATGRFGSGWAWLVIGEDKQLSIDSTANQNTFITPSGRMSITGTGVVVDSLEELDSINKHWNVLLGIDVWEHAYYLKYQNRRADYVTAWFNVVNWDFVSERFQKLTA